MVADESFITDYVEAWRRTCAICGESELVEGTSEKTDAKALAHAKEAHGLEEEPPEVFAPPPPEPWEQVRVPGMTEKAVRVLLCAAKGQLRHHPEGERANRRGRTSYATGQPLPPVKEPEQYALVTDGLGGLRVSAMRENVTALGKKLAGDELVMDGLGWAGREGIACILTPKGEDLVREHFPDLL